MLGGRSRSPAPQAASSTSARPRYEKSRTGCRHSSRALGKVDEVFDFHRAAILLTWEEDDVQFAEDAVDRRAAQPEVAQSELA